MATTPASDAVQIPTPVQIFAEAKRIAKEDCKLSEEFRFNDHLRQVTWEWSSQRRTGTGFDFDGRIVIVATSAEEPHAYSRIDEHDGVAWIKPDRISLVYRDRRVWIRLQFMKRNDSLLACTWHPTSSLSAILERLDLTTAHVTIE